MAKSVNIRVGTAIIEMDRIKKACKNKKFLSDYFSADEIRFLVKHRLNNALIAENYCVKIAIAKALGTGMRFMRAHEITVIRDRLGAPMIILDGYAKMLEQREDFEISISVSHCKDYATASVILTR